MTNLTPTTESSFMDLVKFDVKKDELSALAKSSAGLKISGADDKVGYKKVHEAQMVLADIRKKGEDDRLSFKRMLISTGKKLDEYHLSIFAPIIEEENRLKEMKNEVKKKIEEEKQEKIRIEQERVAGLVTRFGKLGLEKDYTGVYRFMAIEISDAEFITSTPVELDALEKRVVAMATEEKSRLAALEKERLEKEKELEKIKKEQEARQKVLDDKEAELKKKEKESQDKIDAQNKIIADKEKSLKDAENAKVREKELAVAKEKAAKDALEKKKQEDLAAKKKAEDDKKSAEAVAAKNKQYLAWLKKHDLSAEEIAKAIPMVSPYWVGMHDSLFVLYKTVDEITIK